MRGGQLTLFVVIGLVLMLIVGIFFVMLRSPPEDPIGGSNQAIVSSTVESCIDSFVIEELTSLGEGGGLVVFEGYPSAVVDVGVEDRRVLYGITQNAGGDGLLPEAYDPPRYPDQNVSIQNTQQNPATGLAWPSWAPGYFGDLNFPPLCSLEGSNRPGSTFACSSYPGIPPGTVGQSVQEGLERRIAQRVQSCASPKMLSDVIGQDVERLLDPTARITFTSTNTLVTLNYPLVISGKQEPKTERFSRTYDVRFLKIAQFVRELALADTRNVTFNMTRDYRDLRSYSPGLNVFRTIDVPVIEPSLLVEHDKADLISVLDAESTLDGRSYVIVFLVEHRPPMLAPLLNADIQQVLSGNISAARAADPDDGPVTIEICASCDPLRIEAIDEDGQKDWQEV